MSPKITVHPYDGEVAPETSVDCSESNLMNVLWKKAIQLLKLPRASLQDGAFFGYMSAVRWHSIPLRNQICNYIRRPAIVAPVKLHLSGYEHPIWLRPRTSDYQVYRQIFVEQEYGGDVEATTDVRFILDCGANVGLASVYFLNRFPQAKVLAIEPDPQNVVICRQNLGPYGSRAIVIQGGVWSGCSPLAIVSSKFGAGDKWGVQVRPCRRGTTGCEVVEGYDVLSLLNYADVDHVDILKIDIEGSELPVFASLPDRWLPRVRNLIIELHGDDCSRAVFSALERYKYRLSQRGDLTYFLDLAQPPSNNSLEHVN
jgi:FkbM family methyltransferase